MKNLLKIVIAVLFLAAAANLPARAQEPRALDEKFRGETIDSLFGLLKAKYAYPEIAAKMEAAIREKQKRGEYEALADGERFAEKITADLRAVFDDKHLKLSYSAKPISLNSGMAGAPSPAEIEAARQRMRRENFGVVKVEILKGNVGLIQINYFAPLDWSAEAYAAAFETIANADALIIDVRRNGGSMDINSVPFFCSYLFDKPVPVGSVAGREKNETRQLWTYAAVPGRKFTNKPVYLLTSRRTASGAEGFVSHLKQLKRAVVIGETTMGATMPGMSHRVNEHFTVWISTGSSADAKAENENKGIAPDIATEPEKALKAAHLRAVNQILQTSGDEEWKIQLKKIAADLEGEK